MSWIESNNTVSRNDPALQGKASADFATLSSFIENDICRNKLMITQGEAPSWTRDVKIITLHKFC